MQKQIHFRIRSPEVYARLNEITLQQNNSISNVINDLLEDSLLKERVRKDLSILNESVEKLSDKVNDLGQNEYKNMLVTNRCLAILINENTKNCIELRQKGLDPNNFYKGTSVDSERLFYSQNEFVQDLQEFILNWKPKEK